MPPLNIRFFEYNLFCITLILEQERKSQMRMLPSSEPDPKAMPFS
jgi:hypothetical protein